MRLSTDQISPSQANQQITVPMRCWCASYTFVRFSDDYFRCTACESLVSSALTAGDVNPESGNQSDFYGKNYWFDHQVKELGLPDITERSRIDLTDRCLFWLKEILKRKQPPANILEIGCSHGGNLALQKMAGYEALGIELSPWVVNFARETFGVDVQIGPVEKLNMVPNSFDVITMFDVIEHLAEPRSTINECAKLLKEDGILVIQTPDAPICGDYAHLAKVNSKFIEVLIKEEHLFLFNRNSIVELLHSFDFTSIEFVPALFEYDMFLVASRMPLSLSPSEIVTKHLQASPSGRIVKGMLDLRDESDNLQKDLRVSEKDSTARLEAIEDLSRQLAASEADRESRLESIQELSKQLAASEADRSARLESIQELSKQLAASEVDRSARLKSVEELSKQLAASEADRSARLESIQELSKQLAASEADRSARLESIQDLSKLLEESERDRAARLEVINNLNKQLEETKAESAARLGMINDLRSSRLYKLGRRFGLFKDLEQKLTIL